MKYRFGLPYPTWEGFYLFGIFIALCIAAMMRQINLLLLIAGLMLGPIIVSWFLCRIRKEWFQVERRMPETIHAQTEFRLKLKLTNVSRGTLFGLKTVQRMESEQCAVSSFGLVCNVQCALCSRVLPHDLVNSLFVTPSDDRFAKHCTLHTAHGTLYTFSSFFPRLAPNSDSESEMVCRIDEPGKYVLKPVELVYRFPLGLFECRIRVGRKATFWIYPALLESIPEDLIQMTAQTWDGVSRGTSYSSRTVGDFHSVDSFRPGEDARLIHWRSSARKGELVVRRFDPPQGRWACIVVGLREACNNSVQCAMCSEQCVAKRSTMVTGCNKFTNPCGSTQLHTAHCSLHTSPISLAATLIDRLCRQSSNQTNIVLAHTGINGEIISGHADSTFFHRAMQMLAVAQPEEENTPSRMDEIVEQVKQLVPEGTQILKLENGK